MKEQKRKRRFRWVVRILVACLTVIILYNSLDEFIQETQLKSKDHVGLVDISGEIGDGEASNADDFAKSLDEAYKGKGLKAVILRINSPGGSPVQADYMYNLIQYYRQKNTSIPVYSVCVDMCASAAYYVAAASNEIYANPSSMVGSIGVLYNGFGFVDTLQKIGVSRRLFTAGKNKDFLDPFSPVNPQQAQLLQVMLDSVHQTFIEKVKQGRGNRLKITDDLFSGLFWTGTKAKELGLIDGFSSTGQLMHTLKQESIIDYTIKKSVLDRFTKSIHSSMVSALPKASNQIRF
ncbi:MAG: S49 family peptidase [Gammaproteobacteria bacterium]|nr:S49 family peptidase [Gammaproteobacteria bacterium]